MSERVNEDMAALAAVEPDAQLMLRVKDGDAASFGLLLARHRVAIIRFLYRMVESEAVAEELAQEVFLRVYRARATYEPTAKFTTWIFRIAMHLALNSLRDGRGERAGESLDETTRGFPGARAAGPHTVHRADARGRVAAR